MHNTKPPASRGTGLEKAHTQKTDPWHHFEAFPGLNAFRHVWQRRLGELFPAVNILCLRPSPNIALRWDCPLHCGCLHSIIPRHDRTGAIAICRCRPANCPDIDLTIEQATPLVVDFPRLGRALARAFQSERKHVDFPLPFTAQVGSWSTQAVPIILTIQFDPEVFSHVVADLSASLRHPFILFAPTARSLNARSTELLAAARAAFFPLDSTVTINADGTLAPTTPPSDLFATLGSIAPSSPRHAPCAPLPAPRPPPRYALRKGLGVWHLIFDGKEADIRHEKGILYVAWLLYNPPDHPIHALDLMAKVPEIYRQQLGLPALVDQTTGQTVALESHARLQERSLALDDREAMRRLYRKEKQLEAILDSDASEPEKAEALRELEAIIEFQRQHGRRNADAAQRAVWAIRNAIRRLHHHLLTALDPQGNPHPVFHPFANHIQNYILTPSSRYFSPTRSGPRGTLAGCFTYEPPHSLPWAA